MNRIILVGRLTKDPELRYTSSGKATASFNLAVNRNFKSADGPEADFINIVVWNKPAENAANYLKKGSLAGVDGRLQTRNYEGNDGKRVYVTEVVAESVQFLDSKGSGSSSEGNNPRRQNEPPRTQNKPDNDPFGGGSIDISSDDLPF